MRLTTLGTGTAAPSPTRVCSGQLVAAGAVRLLLDCGSGVVHRMAALGVDWMGITHLALTHFHADHVSDVATLLVAWQYGDLPPRSAPVALIGPPGTAALLTRLAAAFGQGVREPSFPLQVQELAPGSEMSLEPDGAVLAARKVPHTEESVAYSITHRGRRLVYTGDTGYDQTLAEWAAGCDVLLAECSLPWEMDIHLTPAQCGMVARTASPALLALTHFYPPVERVDIRAEVARHFGGDVALATDGWHIDIEDR